MAAAIINTIGVVSGIATLIGFSSDFISLPNDSLGPNSGSPVKIQVGLNGGDAGPKGDSLSGSAGDMPRLTGYNNNGETTGGNNLAPGDTSISNGGAGSTYVANNGGQQVPGLDLEAGNNAICIAAVLITWANPSKTTRVWLGDAGVECGQRWYPSGIIINADNYEPACTFIDGDHTDGTRSSAVYIHFPHFFVEQGGEIDNTNAKYYCHRPAMKFNNDGPSKMRRAANSTSVPDDQLVVSGSKRWSAIDVCDSISSYGPDYVSLFDNMFCNMKTREVLPVCTDAAGEDCFDLDGVTGGSKSAEKRNVVKRSAYNKVFDWSKKPTNADNW